ncbi:uncharacterized protein EI90DRAFT_3020990, partial [Cantharellus anzutake]|uniref:uncharacterized protein n=1 Tax=Cantharellus anzutake TaxID=1750568 RepID=UPI001904F5B2
QLGERRVVGDGGRAEGRRLYAYPRPSNGEGVPGEKGQSNEMILSLGDGEKLPNRPGAKSATSHSKLKKQRSLIVMMEVRIKANDYSDYTMIRVGACNEFLASGRDVTIIMRREADLKFGRSLSVVGNLELSCALKEGSTVLVKAKSGLPAVFARDGRPAAPFDMRTACCEDVCIEGRKFESFASQRLSENTLRTSPKVNRK